ncbi:MAG: Imm51 family immunity protein [Bacteroidota bacterium]
MTDKETYSPFILIDEDFRSLILSDTHMVSKQHIFHERADEGWEGNGYDWTSIARVLVAEELSHLSEDVSFDPEAGMLSAQGSLDALQELGAAMLSVYNDDARIRDLLSRAELD